MNLEEDLVQQDGLNMKRTNFTEEDIIALARQKGIKEVCEFNITCKESQEKARRDYNISIKDQLEIEAPYHSLTNGGHITKIDLGSKAQGNEEAFEKHVRMMKEANIGLGKLEIG